MSSEGAARLEAPIHLAPGLGSRSHTVIHIGPPLHRRRWNCKLACAGDVWCAEVDQPDHPLGVMLGDPGQIQGGNCAGHEDRPVRFRERRAGPRRSSARSERSEGIGEALEEGHPLLSLFGAEGRFTEIVMVILNIDDWGLYTCAVSGAVATGVARPITIAGTTRCDVALYRC